jgi:hypothetical protein
MHRHLSILQGPPGQTYQDVAGPRPLHVERPRHVAQNKHFKKKFVEYKKKLAETIYIK